MLKFFKILILILLLVIISSFIYNIISNINNTEIINYSKSSILKPNTNNIKNKNNITNILILGRPGENYIGSNLTDTIILAHLSPENEKVVLISLPRDLLVKIPNTNNLTKINALYNLIGIEGIKNTIQNITGLKIDNHVIIDLSIAKEIIDLVDGLNVPVPQDIYDPYFPGPNYTYDPFILEAGWRYLDGRNVLRYMRTRYTSPNGDFDRMFRQQQIMRLIKQKVLELNPLWDFSTYAKIFNSLQKHINTDLSILELKNMWEIAKQTKSDNIKTIVIDKKETDLLISGTALFGQAKASVVWPKIGQENYEDIKKYIQNNIY